MSRELLRRVDPTAPYDKNFFRVFRIWLQLFFIFEMLLPFKDTARLCKSFILYMVACNACEENNNQP